LDPASRETPTTVEGGSPFLASGHTYATVTDKISSIVLTQPTRRGWWAGFLIAFSLLMVLNYAVAKLLAVGVGIWGVNIPIA